VGAGPQTFPRRDEHGRVIRLSELLAAAGFGTLLGWIAVVVISGLTAAVGLGQFGTTSGWLALILPALTFFDDLRGWRPYRIRILVALVCAVAAIVLGLLAAATAARLPPIVSGAVGALVAALVYSPAWFIAIRAVTGPTDNVNSRSTTRRP
jgi:hypothetical protein